MNLDEFVAAFAAEFEDTPEDVFKPNTDFKALDEWDSLTALSIISMVDEELGKTITGADLRANKTIEDVFNYAMNK